MTFINYADKNSRTRPINSFRIFFQYICTYRKINIFFNSNNLKGVNFYFVGNIMNGKSFSIHSHILIDGDFVEKNKFDIRLLIGKHISTYIVLYVLCC